MSCWLSTRTLMPPSVPEWLEDICQRLVDNDPTLQCVELTTHRRLDDVCARVFADALEENNTVNTLILSCFSIVDDGAYAISSVLGKNTSIQKLQLRDLRNSREIITFFQSLLQNTAVEELSLRHCLIDNHAAEVIARVLEQHPRIQEVRIVDSQLVGENSLKLLCKGLQSSRSIQRLFLVNNDIESDGASDIATILHGGPACLRELHLCENSLGDEGVATLTRGVLASTSLRLLDLRSNGITAEGALALQGAIVTSQFLLQLCLGSNQLGNLGVTALARGLRHRDSVLQSLDLSDNGIDKTGAKALSSMLRVNQSLTELNLSLNAVGDEGTAALAASLVRNTRLKWISLRRNDITNAGAAALAKTLPHMHGLKELTLAKNHITNTGAMALLQGLRDNVELEYLHVVDDKLFNEPVAREIIHWIRLNKAGRRIFRQTNKVPSPLWPRVYSRISTDFDILFHFVSEKPDILSAGLVM